MIDPATYPCGRLTHGRPRSIAGIVVLALLLTACSPAGSKREESDSGVPTTASVAPVLPGVSTPLSQVCDVGLCVADTVVLPSLVPLETAVDLLMTPTLAALSMERVWAAGQEEGIFGKGWLSVWDVRVEGTLISGPLPASPVTAVSEDSELRLADGTSFRFRNGRPDRVCPSGGLCVDAEWEDEQLGLSAPDATVGVTLRLFEGRVVSAVVADGRQVDYSYEDGVLTAVRTPAGRTEYTYENGLLVSVAGPSGRRTFTYGADGRVVESTDRDGGVWRFRTLAPDRTEVVAPDGRAVTHRFSSGKLVESSSVEDGLLLLRTFDDLGLLREERPTEGRSIERTAVGVFRVTQRRAGAPALVADYGLDRLGRVRRVESASGVVEYEYREDSSLVSAVKTSTGSTTYGYGGDGLLVTVTDPDGYEITVTRDASGAPVRISDGVTATDFSYDAEGNVIEQRSGESSVTASYRPEGVVERITDAGGVTTTYDYDGRGRIASAKDATSVSFNYDDIGQLSPSSNTPELPMLDVGGSHRLPAPEATDVVSNADGSSTYQYDASTSVTFDRWARPTLVSVDGQTTSRIYDDAGRLTSLTYSSGRSYRMSYTAAGRIASVTTNGVTFNLSWHGDLLTRVTGSNGSEYRFGYDERGKLITAEQGPARWDYSYDRAGNLARIDAPDGSTSYEWNSTGLPISTILASGRERSFEWDGEDLTKIVEASGAQVELTRDPTGRLQSMKSADGELVLAYDNESRVSSFRLPDGRDGAVVWGEDGVASLQVGDHSERWDYVDGEVARVTVNNETTYETTWASPGVFASVVRDGKSLLKSKVDGGRVAQYRGADGETLASFSWIDGALTKAQVGDKTATVDRDGEGRVTRARTDGLTYTANYVGGALSTVSVDDQSVDFEYSEGRLESSTFRSGDRMVKIGWDATGTNPLSFASTSGNGGFVYADGRVVEIDYDDQLRPVAYDDTGNPSAEGTGGEFLDDLFDESGRFRGVDAAVASGPWSPVLESLPAEVGLTMPSVLTADAVVDAALDVAVPATPLPLLPDESKITDSAIDQVIAGSASVDLPIGPSARASIALSPTDSDFAGLLSTSPSLVVADSALKRLAGDPCLLCRVPTFGASLLSGVGNLVTSTVRFVLDNPIVRSLLTSLFVIEQTVLGAICALIPNPGLGFACATGVAAYGVVVGQLLFGDPSSIGSLLVATVVDPFRPLVEAVSNLDAVALVSAVAPIVSQLVIRRVFVGRPLPGRLAGVACNLKRVGCISAGEYPTQAAHILDAQRSVGGVLGRINRTGTDQRRASALRGIAIREGLDRDEWPPAFLRSDRSPVSVHHIDPADNRGAGASLRRQFAGLPDGSRVLTFVRP